ncbi:MAG: copper chaperone PCu(A)C [Arenimonas sp.]|jgi:hypothetical protein
MNVRSFALGLCLLGASSAAVAATPGCVPIIEQGWIRAAPPGAMTLAAYAIVRNPCTRAVAITEVSSGDFAMAMIHETQVQDGVSKMRHVDSLPLPAHGEVRLAPGGTHLMLMSPKRKLKAGDTVQLSLTLADGRLISGDFPIRSDPPK